METPDFDQIARQLHNLIAPMPRSVGEREIAEQLRLVWNARGAADVAMMESYLLALFERVTPAGEPSTPVITQLDRALRTLDR